MAEGDTDQLDPKDYDCLQRQKRNKVAQELAGLGKGARLTISGNIGFGSRQGEPFE